MLCFECDLIQVVINLVTNALQAIATTDRKGEVRVCVRHYYSSAYIEVCDNCPVIYPSLLFRIF